MHVLGFASCGRTRALSLDCPTGSYTNQIQDWGGVRDRGSMAAASHAVLFSNALSARLDISPVAGVMRKRSSPQILRHSPLSGTWP